MKMDYIADSLRYTSSEDALTDMQCVTSTIEWLEKMAEHRPDLIPVVRDEIKEASDRLAAWLVKYGRQKQKPPCWTTIKPSACPAGWPKTKD